MLNYIYYTVSLHFVLLFCITAHFKHIVPTLYNQLKVRLNESQAGSGDDHKAPVVYGLGSVYSSSLVLLVSVVSLLLAFLLGDGLAPSLLLATVLLYLILELYSASVTSQEYGKKYLHCVGFSLEVTRELTGARVSEFGKEWL